MKVTQALTAKAFLATLAEKDIHFVNFRFSTIIGDVRQITFAREALTESLLSFGIAFDGSSIPGWKPIQNSDLLLRPDLSTAYSEDFTSYNTYNVICDVIDTDHNESFALDPRSIAKKVSTLLSDEGLADTAFFGPELEFFIFDNVNYSTDPTHSYFEIDSDEFCKVNSKKLDRNNHGHRFEAKSYYNSVQPLDSLFDLRSEILMALKKTELLEPTLHHHEVGSAQCEIGFLYSSLIRAADNVQIAKHIVKNTASAYGKTATFMPKPIKGDAGSGMHCHISLFKSGENLFAGDAYAGLSEMALFFIGGIAKHIRSICAFTNQTTNSYRRLKPGFEAPVIMSYSKKNRSNCIRIPHSTTPRIECRFPDGSSNPYLAFSAMLLAGLDGIKNRLHPGDPIESNLYNVAPSELENFTKLPCNLKESISELEKNHEFLLPAFPKDLLDYYIKSKTEEYHQVDCAPHPLEFKSYYNC